MADFAKLVLDADTRGLKSAQGDLKDVSTTAGETAKKVGVSMAKLGAGMSIGLTAPLTLFGKAAVTAATDAVELQSMFDTTFGSMAASMNKWAEQTGNALGRSTQEVQESVAVFQGFFKDMLPEAEAAKFSQTMTVLSQDVASFKNLANDDAQRRLFSAVTGEYESLKSLGVVINDTVLKAKAMEMGFGNSTAKLTEQEKVLVRVALLQQKFADASGDVIRTQDSTANQMKKAQAAYEELQVVVGTKLLPVLTPLIEKLAGVLDWFSQLPEPVQNFALVIGAAAAALGPVLIGLGSLISVVATIGPPLVAFAAGLTGIGVASGVAATGATAVGVAVAAAIWPITAIAAAVGAVYLAYKNWDAIVGFVSRMVQGVKTWLVDNLGKILHAALNPIETVKKAFFNLYDAVVGHSYIPDMVDEVGQHMRRLDAELVKPAAASTSKAAQSFRDLQMELRSLLSVLFPEEARRNVYLDQVELLNEAMKRGQIDANSYAAAMERAKQSYFDADMGSASTVSAGITETGSIAEILTPAELQKLMKAANDNADGVEAANVRVVESFKDMADKTLASISNLASAIKGGGFLDILSGVIDLGLQLGSIGAFGSKVAGKINRPVPGYAGGTSFHPGGPAIVGERGPELVNMPRGSKVLNNSATERFLGGSEKLQVEVVANNDGFGAIIRNGAGQVVAESAAGLMQGGAQVANSKIAYRQSRRIPGR